MIEMIQGSIFRLETLSAVIETAAGIGYRVSVPLDTRDYLGENRNRQILLYTREIIRDTSRELYGFHRPEDAELFDFLRSLQGIGPSLALNLISAIGAEKLSEALQTEDRAVLVKAPKIGKAKADKILFEASSRLKKLPVFTGSDRKIPQNENMNPVSERVLEALENLGFKKAEIEKVSVKIESDEANSNLSEEALLRAYLQLL